MNITHAVAAASLLALAGCAIPGLTQPGQGRAPAADARPARGRRARPAHESL